ncbi:fibroblast growth factor receptor-like 1 isoform X2 [Bacillus rossius redtenbacheri]
MVAVFVLAVLWRSLLLPVLAQEQNWPEYLVVSPERPELIQILAGKEVRLHCGPKAKHPTQDRSRFHWTYKRCGFGYSFTNCDKVVNKKWQNVTCRSRVCHTRLVLTNAVENDSGLYRCMDRDHVLKTYQLDVVDRMGAPPQLLNKLPANLTVLETSPAVMMCRVLSKQPPSVLWFRRQDARDRDTSNYIQYLDDYYELLNDSSTAALTDELYLSKLIIQRAREQHAGYYVCLAINAQGYSHGGAYLGVRPFRGEDYEGDEDFDSSSLPFLFLIPLALAILAAIAGCLGWLWCRTCGDRDTLPIPLNNNNNNNDVNHRDVGNRRYEPVKAPPTLPHTHRRGGVV